LDGSVDSVNVSSTGQAGNGDASSGSISDDGRIVAFVSNSTNLVPGVTSTLPIAYVRNRSARTTERLDISSTGAPGVGATRVSPPAVSADGRYAAFVTDAQGLANGVNHCSPRLYIRDLQLKTTAVVPIPDGADSIDDVAPSLSAQGRYVAYLAYVHDASYYRSVFVYDQTTHISMRVSDYAPGWATNEFRPVLSRDGRYVVFGEQANVREEWLGNIFVRDLSNGSLDQVTVPINDGASDPNNAPTAITDDGRFVCLLLRP
jgi:Tol biopolymer transport system component